MIYRSLTKIQLSCGVMMEIFIGKSVPVNGHIQECDAYRLNKINISLYSAASPSFLPKAPPKKTKEKKLREGSWVQTTARPTPMIFKCPRQKRRLCNDIYKKQGFVKTLFSNKLHKCQSTFPLTLEAHRVQALWSESFRLQLIWRETATKIRT